MLTINPDRMLSAFQALSEIGATGDGGVHRPTFSEAHLAARKWYRTEIEWAGLEFHADGAGNHSALLPSSDPKNQTLLLGSHLDSVPHGGRYDGALGVMAAFEVLRMDHDSFQFHLGQGHAYVLNRGPKGSVLQIDTPDASVRALSKSGKLSSAVNSCSALPPEVSSPPPEGSTWQAPQVWPVFCAYSSVHIAGRGSRIRITARNKNPAGYFFMKDDLKDIKLFPFPNPYAVRRF